MQAARCLVVCVPAVVMSGMARFSTPEGRSDGFWLDAVFLTSIGLGLCAAASLLGSLLGMDTIRHLPSQNRPGGAGRWRR